MNKIKKIVLIGFVLYVLIALVAVMINDSEAVITSISLVGLVIYHFVNTIFPFAYVVITGNYLKGVLYYWAIGCLFLLFLSIVFPAILMSIKPESSAIIARVFPETNSLVEMFILGWLAGLFWCGIAYGLRVVFLYFKGKRIGNNR